MKFNDAMKTGWFPEDMKPVRPGIYEKDFSDYSNITEYQYWDGKRWYYGEDTPNKTLARFDEEYYYGSTPPLPRAWRGLKEQTFK